MTTYVKQALFLYAPEARGTLEKLQSNPFGCQVDAGSIESFLADPGEILGSHQHVVVSATLSGIKEVIKLSVAYKFSVGIIPLQESKKIVAALGLPNNFSELSALALQDNAPAIDLVFCNEELMLLKAVIGWMPVLDSSVEKNKLEILFHALRRTFSIRLRSFSITTANGKEISTVASGCMLVQHHRGDYASKLVKEDSSVTDCAVSLLVSSPFSVIEYERFLIQLLMGNRNNNRLPSSVGYIKSRAITISSQAEINVLIDGDQVTKTPVYCETKPSAARVNVSAELAGKSTGASGKEAFKVANLPDEKESGRFVEKRIPFFSYASEERFKDLFLVLNKDSKISTTYTVFMILSTLIASAGLYLDSSAVIIGAMLLAPLMSPLVSVAMGLLRGNNDMLKSSAKKILLGIVLSLLSAATFSIFFSFKEVSGQMIARLNPTILDLSVAIFSGVVGAYAKSHKEIAQNLAGVAIAVALVPPLAVAGIGIGRGDLHFFLQAFLLFSTNLVGIILAATFTFRVLGFSSVVKSRRGVALITALAILITFPLYISYNQVVERMTFENRLKTDRFLVNGKYVIIEGAQMHRKSRVIDLHLDLLVRKPLSRKELGELKQKLQSQFSEKIDVTATVNYRL